MTDPWFVAEVIPGPSGRAVDFRFLDVNPAFEDLTGLTRAATVGRTMREVAPDEEHWLQTYEEVVSSGAPVRFERLVPAAPGRHFEVVAYSPGPGRFACLFADVTERKRTASDIADRKRVEEAARRSAAILAHAGKLANLG